MTSPQSADLEPLPVRRVPPARLLQWLRLGWADLWRAPSASLLHGIVVAVGGWLTVLLAREAWWVAPGAFTAFVLVGPILCTGLYELSRLHARGVPAGIPDVAQAWARESRPLVRLGLLLLGLGVLWVAASALLFTLFVDPPPRTLQQFVRYALVDQGDTLFVLWTIVGGLGAAVVFALTAVSPPLLLGRVVGFRRALLTSVRAVGENPVTMGLWSGVILAAIALSLVTGMLGFVLSVPVIGHATWHAYRDLVVTDGVPLRFE